MDIMIDLETIGVESDAAITAIGAVAFSIEKLKISQTHFYNVVDLESACRAGGTMSASTIQWWMKQSTEARSIFNVTNAYNIDDALNNFSTYIDEYKRQGHTITGIWGNGSDFDNVVLRSAYKRLNLETPWDFWQNRCFRTMSNSFSHIKRHKPRIAHNALHDAIAQARTLIDIYKSIRSN